MVSESVPRCRKDLQIRSAFADDLQIFPLAFCQVTRGLHNGAESTDREQGCSKLVRDSADKG